jgi:hypothetical protein
LLISTAGAASVGSVDITGSGWTLTEQTSPRTLRFTHFDISAHRRLSREFGHVGFRLTDALGTPLELQVEVDCVSDPFQLDTGPGVTGAWVSGAARKVSPQPNAFGFVAGDRFAFYVVDGGTPSKPVATGGTPVDEFDAFASGSLSCKALPDAGYTPNVSDGNIVIQPLIAQRVRTEAGSF